MNIFKKRAEEYFLVGFANKHIGRNPPTVRRLLQNYFFYREQNKTIDNSVILAIKNAMIVWENMDNAFKRPDNCERKLKRIITEWKELLKNKYYKSDGQDQRRKAFIEKLDTEFHLTHEPNIEIQTSDFPESSEFQELEWSDMPDTESTEFHEIGSVVRKRLSEMETSEEGNEFNDGKNTIFLAVDIWKF